VTISKVTVTDGRASGPYDQVRAEKAVRELLLALGEDPDREGLKETPARVARAMKENFEGLWQSPEDVLTTTFDIGHEELVIVRDIEVFFTLRTPPHAIPWCRTCWLYPQRENYWTF
jgi:GTP cyclohydrolase I